jgi:hypothetical protein
MHANPASTIASVRLAFPMPSRDSKSVTFRVSGAALERLTREAETLGVTRSQRAREILQAALGDEFEHELLGGMKGVQSSVAGLREDLARTLVSVIDTLQTDPASGAKRFTLEQVQDMVRRYLGRP